MIAIAVLALLVGIAIPAYQGYIAESRSGAARANAEHLRTAVEDYFLDNESYTGLNGLVWDGNGTTTTDPSPNPLGWSPTGDDGQYDYTITAPAATRYTITVKNIHGGTTASLSRN
ncbi:MAG: hypothetical protein KDG50_03920 [Chromatiales bacterium]|nr:hypothetical protein [Chromatiales bacterium]